jgi:hypothetical protein
VAGQHDIHHLKKGRDEIITIWPDRARTARSAR